jgi:hypothetical protein
MSPLKSIGKMQALSTIKGLHSVIIMLNKKRNLEIIICIFILAVSGSGMKCLKSGFHPASGKKAKLSALLNQLTSTDEAIRFGAIERFKGNLDFIESEHLEVTLTSLSPKNVSTLIFVLTRMRSDALYRLSTPARRSIENSQGSFPNIAYYYARVDPRKGLPQLIRLYDEHRDRRIPICKAMGESALSGALFFLTSQALKEKKEERSIMAQLAGLQAYPGNIDHRYIQSLLEQKLNTEEVIMLAKVKTGFRPKHLMALWKTGAEKRSYATEYILGHLPESFAILQRIVNSEIRDQKWDYVIQLMQSDCLQRSEDEDLRKYREAILAAANGHLHQ